MSAAVHAPTAGHADHDHAHDHPLGGSFGGQRCGHDPLKNLAFAFVCLHRQLYSIGRSDRKTPTFAFVCLHRWADRGSIMR